MRGWLALLSLVAACSSTEPGAPPPRRDAGVAVDLAPPPPAADMVAPADAAGLDAAMPPALCKTSYLDPRAYLQGFADPQWYIDNIPFLDIPDVATGTVIQPVYYYRWSTLKRALRYTDAQNGYVFLEFLEPPGYASAFGAVDAAAGHHLYEARWLHESRYGEDYLRYWLLGAGKGGVREYSFWVADSTWARYLVDSDADFAKSLLAPLAANWQAWNDHFDSTLGLYWQVPVWDAMEYMADTYSAQNPDKDPYHGGPGFRPTINAYQYADARAIAKIAGTLAGDSATAATYAARAAALVKAMQKYLWADGSHFFVHKYRDGGALFDAAGGREEIGFVPWQFDMPDPGYESAWSHTITDPGVFYTGYGPTTVAKDNPYYLYSYSKGACCHWNGPLWPYSTTQTLKAMANLLNDYQQSYVTAADYFTLLANYARSQYKNGEPYVAEALDPDDSGTPIWTYDSPAHSEHYNHSGFVDPVITGLIGLHPNESDVVQLAPLVPAAWDHFMLENVSYHGHYLTIVWDADGSHYRAGSGFSLYQDCTLLARRATLGPLAGTLLGGSHPFAQTPRLVNVLANGAGNPYPRASASYTFSVDDINQINDGIVLYDRSVGGSPNDTAVHNRWTNYSSPQAADWIQVDMGQNRTLSELTLHIYDDGKGVRPPLDYTIATSLDGSGWTPVAATRVPAQPAAGPNVARFPPVVARYLRVTFQVDPKCSSGTGCAGVTEMESWVAP